MIFGIFCWLTKYKRLKMWAPTIDARMWVWPSVADKNPNYRTNVASYVSLTPGATQHIRHRPLHSMRFRSHRLTRMSLLIALQTLPFAWSREHHWTVKDWRYDACSDESRFQFPQADRWIYIQRRPPEVYCWCSHESLMKLESSLTSRYIHESCYKPL